MNNNLDYIEYECAIILLCSTAIIFWTALNLVVSMLECELQFFFILVPMSSLSSIICLHNFSDVQAVARLRPQTVHVYNRLTRPGW